MKYLILCSLLLVTVKCSVSYNCATNNPCSPSVIVPGKFHYPHDNANKFVQCSQWGQCYEMPCPSTLVWNDAIQTCDHNSGGGSSVAIDSPVSYNCDTNNPCSPNVIVPNKFHYPHDNANKFVQCSEHGQCYEKACPSSLVWKDASQTCTSGDGSSDSSDSSDGSSDSSDSNLTADKSAVLDPTVSYNCATKNPCSPSVIVPNKFHYPHDNANKFVQCSEHGQCYEMPCAATLVWDDSAQTCN